MNHSFDKDIAVQFGIAEAIILNHMQFWIEKNEANGKNFYDGSYWTYNSTKAYAEIFPYFSQRQIQNALKHLRDEGILKTGNYNDVAYDRTLWYAFTEKGISIMQKCKMDYADLSNGLCKNVEPIPDNKTDNINTDSKQIKKSKKSFETVSHPNDFSQGGNVHRVENLQTNALSSNNINALSANNINASKERKKKADSYDDILSDIDDSELKELYFEYIKMRKLIKKPMTDRALKMLVSKVNALEPTSIDRQKKLLENAISSNWLSVYPLKDDNKQSYNQNKKPVPASSDYDFELDNFWNM